MDTATGGLNVTITSKVAVYAPAERAETLLLSRLYPSLLSGFDHKRIIVANLTDNKLLKTTTSVFVFFVFVLDSAIKFQNE